MSIDFADYFGNAPIGFHCLGPDGVIVAVNEAELALLGYARRRRARQPGGAECLN